MLGLFVLRLIEVVFRLRSGSDGWGQQGYILLNLRQGRWRLWLFRGGFGSRNGSDLPLGELIGQVCFGFLIFGLAATFLGLRGILGLFLGLCRCLRVRSAFRQRGFGLTGTSATWFGDLGGLSLSGSLGSRCGLFLWLFFGLGFSLIVFFAFFSTRFALTGRLGREFFRLRLGEVYGLVFQYVICQVLGGGVLDLLDTHIGGNLSQPGFIHG